jgi:hypothetical protein
LGFSVVGSVPVVDAGVVIVVAEMITHAYTSFNDRSEKERRGHWYYILYTGSFK